jgi:hypothetical protein
MKTYPLLKHHTIKTYWGVEVQLHAFLTSGQDEPNKVQAPRHKLRSARLLKASQKPINDTHAAATGCGISKISRATLPELPYTASSIQTFSALYGEMSVLYTHISAGERVRGAYSRHEWSSANGCLSVWYRMMATLQWCANRLKAS